MIDKKVCLLMIACWLLLLLCPLRAQHIEWDSVTTVIDDRLQFIIDINGNCLTQKSYTQIGKVPGKSYYLAYNNSRMGLIDEKEEIILPFVFRKIYIDTALYIGELANDKIAFITKEEEKKIITLLDGNDYQLPSLNCYFSENILAIKYKEKWGYIDQSGKEVISFEYDEAETFRDGYAIVAKRDDEGIIKYGLINRENKIIIPILYDQLYHERNNNFIAALEYDSPSRFRLNYKYGMINTSNKTTIPISYDTLKGNDEYTKSGKASYFRAFKKETGWKIIDSLDNEKVCCYESMGFLGDHLLEAKKEKWGVIDTSGKEIIPFKYDRVRIIEKNIIALKKDNKWAYSKSNGTLLTGFIFDKITYYEFGLSLVQRENISQFINTQGTVIMDNVPTEWFKEDNLIRHLNPLQSPRVFMYFLNGKYGLMDLTKKIVYPPIANHAIFFPHMWYKRN